MVVTAGAAPEAGGADEQPGRPAAPGCGARGGPGAGGPRESGEQRYAPCSPGPCAEGRAVWRTGKTFLYCEPHKRIKEVLEEELYIKRDECRIKNPPAGAYFMLFKSSGFHCNSIGYQHCWKK